MDVGCVRSRCGTAAYRSAIIGNPSIAINEFVQLSPQMRHARLRTIDGDATHPVRTAIRRTRVSKNNRSAVAIPVGRTSRVLVLVPPSGWDALTVSLAVIAVASDLPAPLKCSLIWGCDAEMARRP